MRKGITGSPWIGFENFTRLFSSYWFPIIIKNTLTLSLLNLVVGFPIPIILALLLNEVNNGRFRKTFQTISYAPHFISVVVLCGMLVIFTNPTHGIINILLNKIGVESINFLGIAADFKWVYVLSGVWQEMGWGSIIYFACSVQRGQVAHRSRGHRRRQPAAEDLVHQPAGAGAHHHGAAGAAVRLAAERGL